MQRKIAYYWVGNIYWNIAQIRYGDARPVNFDRQNNFKTNPHNLIWQVGHEWRSSFQCRRPVSSVHNLFFSSLSLWNLAQTPKIILSCSVENFRTIGQLTWMLWTGEMSPDLCFKMNFGWIYLTTWHTHPGAGHGHTGSNTGDQYQGLCHGVLKTDKNIKLPLHKYASHPKCS